MKAVPLATLLLTAACNWSGEAPLEPPQDPRPQWVAVVPEVRLSDEQAATWADVLRRESDKVHDGQAYALVTSTGARAPVERITVDGKEVPPVADHLWLLPVPAQGLAPPDLRADIAKGADPFLELISFTPAPVNPIDQAKLAAAKALGHRIRELDGQMKRAEKKGSLTTTCQMFVGFDFLASLPVIRLLNKLGSLTYRDLVALASDGNPGFEKSMHSQTASVLVAFRDIQDKGTGKLVRALGAAKRKLGRRIEGAASDPKILDSGYEFLKSVGSHIATSVVAGTRGTGKHNALGLVHEHDLLRFAQGELAIHSPSKLMNAEPNTSAFFMFGEMFARSLDKKLKGSHWPRWTRTAIAAEVLFVESYATVGKPVSLQADYYKIGPNTSSAEHRAARREKVAGLAQKIKQHNLLKAHRAIVKAAFDKDHATKIPQILRNYAKLP